MLGLFDVVSAAEELGEGSSMDRVCGSWPSANAGVLRESRDISWVDRKSDTL